METKYAGFGDPSEIENEREGEMKVTLEVFSLVDSEGSDALNEIRNLRKNEEACELVHKFVFKHLNLTCQNEIYFEFRKLVLQ